MRVKDSIAKAILWAYIKVLGLQRRLGAVGHGAHCCGLKPWELTDQGPWEGVCSPRICPDYEYCKRRWG